MPIAQNQLGRPGMVARPGRRPLEGRAFRSPPFSSRNPTITGITRDSSGVALAACTLDLFRTADDSKIDTTVSDGAGAYTLTAGGSGGPFYVVAYKAGAPDVAGTTVNTLIAS